MKMETLSSTNQLSAHPTSIDWTIGHTESAAQLIKEEKETQTHRHTDTQTHRHTDTDTDTDTQTHRVCRRSINQRRRIRISPSIKRLDLPRVELSESLYSYY